MSNLSDRDIDRLSREAADLFEPDHSSLSWNKLEQKLVEQIPERPPDGFSFSRINPFVWGTAVIIIAGLSVFTIKNFNYSQHSTRSNQKLSGEISTQITGNTKKETETGSLRDSLNTDHSITSLNDKKSVLSSEEKVNLSKDEKRSSSSNTYSKSQPLTSSGNSSIYKSEKNSGNTPGGKSPATDNKNDFDASGVGFIGETISSGHLSNSGSNQAENAGRITNKHALPSVVSMGRFQGAVRGNDSLLNLPARSGIPIDRKSLRINRSLNFGISFGPDYTDAGGITNNQLGNNIGLTVGYYITNKISVNTGIFYSNKFFWAPGHDHANSNMQPWRVVTAAAPLPVDYINGSANIWELPLTLRYDFAQNERSKFFVNAGLSSYFVMKQTYINFFYSGQRLLAYKTFDDEQINYWFKVADISFGFETDLGKGFSFQAEPFLKLPLTNMGSNNLKLNSYGFLLSFKYSPVLSRTKK